MKSEIGEYIVGAYLELIKGCNIVSYNVKPQEEGLKGLNELDVVGINTTESLVFLCEVTTHLRGILYGNPTKTIDRIEKKFENQKQYAEQHFSKFKVEYMFWSPVVSTGLIEKLKNSHKLHGLKFIINEEYTKCIKELEKKAKLTTKNTGNPAFRMLQILSHLRREK